MTTNRSQHFRRLIMTLAYLYCNWRHEVRIALRTLAVALRIVLVRLRQGVLLRLYPHPHGQNFAQISASPILPVTPQESDTIALTSYGLRLACCWRRSGLF